MTDETVTKKTRSRDVQALVRVYDESGEQLDLTNYNVEVDVLTKGDLAPIFQKMSSDRKAKYVPTAVERKA